jgi:hypothetical protein
MYQVLSNAVSALRRVFFVGLQEEFRVSSLLLLRKLNMSHSISSGSRSSSAGALSVYNLSAFVETIPLERGPGFVESRRKSISKEYSMKENENSRLREKNNLENDSVIRNKAMLLNTYDSMLYAEGMLKARWGVHVNYFL